MSTGSEADGDVPSDTFFTAPSFCPGCGSVLDAHTATSKDAIKPVSGDFTVCIVCSVILRFDDNLRLWRATADDLEAAKTADPENFRRLMVAKRVAVTRIIMEASGRYGKPR